MKPLSLEAICAAVNGKCLNNFKDVDSQAVIRNVTTDSRAVQAGDLFVALPGERFDGHQFVAAVLAAGAAGAIVRPDAKLDAELVRQHGRRLIGVRDTIAALGALGRYHRNLLSTRVVAITGSNGKTTTKRMLHHILAKKLKGTCSPKSFNNNIGVPLTLLGVSEGDDYVVCEVGSNAPGEIETLSAICQPDIAVITSVAETHLEKLGSIEGVAAEKASIFTHLRKGGTAIYLSDNLPLQKAMATRGSILNGVRVVTFGASGRSDLSLTKLAGNPGGLEFEINSKVRVVMPQPGRHNATNALAAIAVAIELGFTLEEAAAALADFGGVEMRLQAIAAGSVRVINDAYNANPASVTAAADVLADQGDGRKVMIVGDMRELGENSPALHERTGSQIAQRRIDLLICVGPLGRYIGKGAAGAGQAVETFETVESAGESLPKLLSAGDVVLLKGSRAMAMERLIPVIQKAFGGPE